MVMGIRHVSLPVEGVQFHPESVLTPDGPHLLANFLRLAGEGEAGVCSTASRGRSRPAAGGDLGGPASRAGGVVAHRSAAPEAVAAGAGRVEAVR